MPRRSRASHDAAHAPVDLADVVAVLAGPAHAAELVQGHDGRVGRRQRQVEEEGLLPGLLDDALGAPGDGGHDLLQRPAGDHRPRRAEHHLRLGNGGGLDDAVLLEPGEGREVGDIVAEVGVEAAVHGTSRDGPFVVDAFVQGQARGVVAAGPELDVVRRRGAVVEGPVPAQVPLADAVGAVPLPPQQPGHGEAVGLDESALPLPEDAPLQARAPAVAPGEHGVAAGRAHAGGSVGVGEAHALGGEAVQVRRGDPRFGVVAARVPVAEVIGQDEDDVRLFQGGSCRGLAGPGRRRLISPRKGSG